MDPPDSPDPKGAPEPPGTPDPRGRRGWIVVTLAGVALALLLVAIAVGTRSGGAFAPGGQSGGAPAPATVPTSSGQPSQPPPVQPGQPSSPGAPVRRFPVVPASAEGPPPALAVPGAPELRYGRLLGACCSESRAGRQADAIILHSTESEDAPGIGDLRRLGSFFARKRVSAHVANDAAGNSSRYVPDSLMAYHASYWNISSLGIEQMGFGRFTRGEWLARPAQLEATARWIAHWARRYRIPIRRCSVTGIAYNRNKRVVAGRIVRRGVCSHAQVDPRNRSDPGAGYPWDRVLRRARTIAGAAKQASGARRPPIRQNPVPFGSVRREQMRRYALRHYGIDDYRLLNPKLIVEHYTGSHSYSSAFNTFASNEPDGDFHERPGTCTHFIIERNGVIHQVVPLWLMCRHVVGLNHVSVGIEHVGTSDASVMGNRRELASSLALTRWLQAQLKIPASRVIGHGESLLSPFYRERVPRFRNRTNGDFAPGTMRRYRRLLAGASDAATSAAAVSPDRIAPSM